MKNTIKLLGILALAAVIGFSMTGCDFGGNDESNGNENGGNTGGSGGTNPTIHVKNSTGYSFWSMTGGLYIKPDTEMQSWGSNWVGFADFNDQTTRAVTLTNYSVGQSIDIRIYTNSKEFIKSGAQIQEGMIVTISQNDWQP